jgi:hypothetical protein
MTPKITETKKTMKASNSSMLGDIFDDFEMMPYAMTMNVCDKYIEYDASPMIESKRVLTLYTKNARNVSNAHAILDAI